MASVSEFCAGGFSNDTVVNPHLKNYFGYCLYKSAARMKAMLELALVDHGLVTSDLGILRILEAGGPLSQVELGGSMGIDKATMVKLIDGLEEKKLVERKGSGGDRRVKLVQITAAGVKKRKIVALVRDKVEKDFLAHLTETERQALRTILPKLLK
ncbi:MAG: MarR family winged helix-turn-helix transcriptional regulator [Bdellovibrionota bacterium]